MYIFGLVVFVLISLLLIGVVLIQNPKGAGIGSAFGGSTSDVFAPGGASSFFTKITLVLAATFIVMALLLSHWARNGLISLGESNIDSIGAVGVASEIENSNNADSIFEQLQPSEDGLSVIPSLNSE